MPLHNDRHTSRTSASLDRDEPDTIVSAFSSSRGIAHSSSNSVRRDSKVHHRLATTRIIGKPAGQNHANRRRKRNPAKLLPI